MTGSGGKPAVMKLVMPHDGNREPAVLRLVDGEGCVRLQAADEQRGALPLERLGPSMADLAVSRPGFLEVSYVAAAAANPVSLPC